MAKHGGSAAGWGLAATQLPCYVLRHCRHCRRRHCHCHSSLPLLSSFLSTSSTEPLLTVAPLAPAPACLQLFPKVKATLTERQAIDMQVLLALTKTDGKVVDNRLNNRVTLPLAGRRVFRA